MTLFALLLTLLIDQAWRPALAWQPTWNAWGWCDVVRRQLDAGHSAHGWLVWAAAVGVPALAVAAVHHLLWQLHGLLAFAWNVMVLVATLGFRHFSHPFTEIRLALESGDEGRARALFAQWRGGTAVDWPRQELLRRVIAYAALDAHRYVLGVAVAFVLLAALGLGPAGALAYRLAQRLAQQWGGPSGPAEGDVVSPAVAAAARLGWHAIDALPARASALAFAVVGRFEDVLERWRVHATGWLDPSDPLLLAAVEGAIHVRLLPREPGEAGLVGEGSEPQLNHLAALVGLVWRSVVLGLLVLALALLVRLF
ncbi:hypothetical protein Talka_00147 [Tepidimonas alkaliphilus]|uniref:Cobalamin biosynthesis protein CobD n=1 Tax=Tepidimonas alkaliphilus TaxID=2588942 RepID=A0A554WD09_9BURK|nr:cobalamin biosynthesis protein CbiB [Tepidimonas alkaliphilus]TSE21472.1 hypothetical protein Talka_00147 [Tepidimonas alkaliphilus]